MTPEELEKHLQQLKNLPIKGFGRGLIVVPILIVLIIVGLVTSVYQVETEGQAVIKRFGKVISVRPPGLHFKLPFGIDKDNFIPTERVLKEEFGFRTIKAGRNTQYRKDGTTTDESLMLTGDLNVIDVEWVVQYRITDPVQYMHQVRQPSDTIRDISEALMRRIVGNRLGSEVLTIGRVSIAEVAKEEMQDILDSYQIGISVDRVELQDVTPPDPVKPAFNEVNEARQQRERLINEAEKKRNQLIPKARGEADQVIAEAEAYRAQRVNQARGEADRFTSLLEAYQKAPDVTRQRLYIEMMNAVLPKLDQIYIIDESLESVLPLLNLQKNVKAKP
jgi:membrane protease subunit HflK